MNQMNLEDAVVYLRNVIEAEAGRGQHQSHLAEAVGVVLETTRPEMEIAETDTALDRVVERLVAIEGIMARVALAVLAKGKE